MSKNAILLGPPGAGKGTHATEIAKCFNLAHISTGDMLRSNVKQGTPLGKEAKAYMEKGELVPDSLVIAMVEEVLKGEAAANGFLLDGFPRTLEQAKHLDESLKKIGKNLNAVLNLKASKDVILKRLTTRRVCKDCGEIYNVVANPPKTENVCDKCGSEVIQRKDDQEETILNRLEVYDRDTKPLIDYYSQQARLQELDGNQDREVTFQSMKELFEKIEA